MDINTGKLAASSSSFLKKIKENESGNKTSKIDSNKEKNISNKLKDDFFDIKTNNELLKSKLINTNNKLTHYENELSKTQFIEQKLEVIEQLVKENNYNEINKVINESSYKNEKVLKEYFTTTGNVDNQIENAKTEVGKKYNAINKEFKEIEITSQNIISLYSRSFKISNDMVQNINLEELSKSTNINNKRVIDLIS